LTNGGRGREKEAYPALHVHLLARVNDDNDIGAGFGDPVDEGGSVLGELEVLSIVTFGLERFDKDDGFVDVRSLWTGRG
jgi:hypothetical protein